MTNQEKINQFILEHCNKCKNKDTYKCNIIINRSGVVKCTEEDKYIKKEK